MALLFRPIIAAVVGLAGLSSPSWAQKPALTESYDEPGRNPYVEGLNTDGNVDYFTAVPAGKRLVLRHLNCSARTAGGTTNVPLDVALLVQTPASPSGRPYPANTVFYYSAPELLSGEAFYSLDADLFSFVESGVRPSVIVAPEYITGGAYGEYSGAHCVLSGYYVSIPY